jgi:hypothetical protein
MANCEFNQIVDLAEQKSALQAKLTPLTPRLDTASDKSNSCGSNNSRNLFRQLEVRINPKVADN